MKGSATQQSQTQAFDEARRAITTAYGGPSGKWAAHRCVCVLSRTAL